MQLALQQTLFAQKPLAHCRVSVQLLLLACAITHWCDPLHQYPV